MHYNYEHHMETMLSIFRAVPKYLDAYARYPTIIVQKRAGDKGRPYFLLAAVDWFGRDKKIVTCMGPSFRMIAY